MLKHQAHTALFNLRFRLKKTTSQKQPPNSKAYGYKNLTPADIYCSVMAICFPQAGPCSFLIAKGVLFLTTTLFSVCYVAAERKTRSLDFAFSSCDVFFPAL